MTVLMQTEVVEQELWSNARMKRRQAEILIAEATGLEHAADRVQRAIALDKERAAKATKSKLALRCTCKHDTSNGAGHADDCPFELATCGAVSAEAKP